nr:hypothetical protein BSM_30070 [uncultured archaeon]
MEFNGKIQNLIPLDIEQLQKSVAGISAQPGMYPSIHFSLRFHLCLNHIYAIPVSTAIANTTSNPGGFGIGVVGVVGVASSGGAVGVAVGVTLGANVGVGVSSGTSVDVGLTDHIQVCILDKPVSVLVAIAKTFQVPATALSVKLDSVTPSSIFTSVPFICQLISIVWSTRISKVIDSPSTLLTTSSIGSHAVMPGDSSSFSFFPVPTFISASTPSAGISSAVLLPLKPFSMSNSFCAITGATTRDINAIATETIKTVVHAITFDNLQFLLLSFPFSTTFLFIFLPSTSLSFSPALNKKEKNAELIL